MNINEQKIIDAMSFMDQIWVLETEETIDFTKEYNSIEELYNLFEECYKEWINYPSEEEGGSIFYFTEFSINWLKNRQAEIDAFENLDELQFDGLPKAHTWECCPFCSSEVIIPSYKASFCPNCGKLIRPCSCCPQDHNNCDNCLFYKK